MNPDQNWLLENALRLADDHRKHCEGNPECGISLYALLRLLRMAGVDVPKDMVWRFL